MLGIPYLAFLACVYTADGTRTLATIAVATAQEGASSSNIHDQLPCDSISGLAIVAAHASAYVHGRAQTTLSDVTTNSAAASRAAPVVGTGSCEARLEKLRARRRARRQSLALIHTDLGCELYGTHLKQAFRSTHEAHNLCFLVRNRQCPRDHTSDHGIQAPDGH